MNVSSESAPSESTPSESNSAESAPAEGPLLDLRHLAREPPGRRSSIWAGMVLFIVIEATVVVSLVTSYYYFRVMSEAGWPPPGVPLPDLLAPGIAFLLLSGSAASLLGAPGGRALAGACVLLGAYLAVSLWTLLELPYLWSDHAYGSLVWTLGGYQIAHGTLLFLLAAGVLTARRPWRERSPAAGPAAGGARSSREQTALAVLRMYWTFVLVASVPTYGTLYLVPYVP